MCEDKIALHFIQNISTNYQSMFYYFQIMPSLLSVLHVLILFLAIFPISRLQIRTQTNANSRFVQWMNGLFYLPRGNELRVRKEYRLLSDEERRNYHQAILLLKNDRVHSIIHTWYQIRVPQIS